MVRGEAFFKINKLLIICYLLIKETFKLIPETSESNLFVNMKTSLNFSVKRKLEKEKIVRDM